jgi:hypothetical protein
MVTEISRIRRFKIVTEISRVRRFKMVTEISRGKGVSNLQLHKLSLSDTVLCVSV